MMSLVDTTVNGGCYWKRSHKSPGHSTVIPNGTPFRIAMDGPQSHRYIGGRCADGHYLIEDGEYAGRRYMSANDAVNSVREPSSNAFLYIHFHIDGQWVPADAYRRSENTKIDPAEEEVLANMLRHKQRKASGQVERIKRAAKITPNILG
jgi:hypothetical protein